MYIHGVCTYIHIYIYIYLFISKQWHVQGSAARACDRKQLRLRAKRGFSHWESPSCGLRRVSAWPPVKLVAEPPRVARTRGVLPGSRWNLRCKAMTWPQRPRMVVASSKGSVEPIWMAKPIGSGNYGTSRRTLLVRSSRSRRRSRSLLRRGKTRGQKYHFWRRAADSTRRTSSKKSSLWKWAMWGSRLAASSARRWATRLEIVQTNRRPREMTEALERLVPTTAEQGPVDQVSEVLVAAVESPSDSQVKTDLRKLHK